MLAINQGVPEYEPLPQRFRKDFPRVAPRAVLIRKLLVMNFNRPANSDYPPHARWANHGLAVLIVAICTLVNWALSGWLGPTDLAMVYLLGVVIAAIYSQRNAAISGAVLSLLAFDFFFVPPVFTWRFGSSEYLITGLVLLIVGVTTSALAARARREMQLANEAALAAKEEQLRNSLLASLSHDLRTPLSIIAGSASTLRDNRSRLSVEEQDQLLAAIFEQSRIMSLDVSDVLEMTRLHTGPVTLNRQWYPLEELIGAALERCASKLAAHSVAIDIPPDMPMVRVDGVLIEKLFVNLIENAAKYTPTGAHIRIAACHSNDRISVTIEDDGPGLPGGLEEQLFEKFARAEKEGAHSGSGLGLSICRAIAQLHGMTICGQNRPAGGAQFVVSMPYQQPPKLQLE